MCLCILWGDGVNHSGKGGGWETERERKFNEIETHTWGRAMTNVSGVGGGGDSRG